MPNKLQEVFNQWWVKRDPQQRKQFSMGACVAVIAIIGVSAYYMQGRNKPVVKDEKSVAVIQTGDKRLEDDLRSKWEKDVAESRRHDQRTDADIQKLKTILDDFKQHANAPVPSTDADAAGLDLPESRPTQLASASRGKSGPATAVAPGSANDPATWLAPASGAPMAPPTPEIQPEFVGDITSVDADKGSGRDGADVKKNSKKVYLPVGFMDAMLLTGLKAKTVDSASGDPEPMLLRVQAPAILPNEVRAMLEGCLIVANGYGSLASERIESRLVSLNCVDYEGHSVIEAPLKGILVDDDGVKGLAARPVTKMGANLARMAAAGALSGAGGAINSTATTTSVSSLGATQVIDPNKVGKAALGGGIKSAADELVKIYADLVKQSAPVLEAGAQKKVTAMLTEGAWLEIKDVEF
jgi:conjugal transfer pilus assembly protein TraB